MEDNGGSKLTGIRQIVRLKEILQKWQAVTIGPKAGESSRRSRSRSRSREGLEHMIDKKIENLKAYDSDEESCASPNPPTNVPKGYLAVYVGPELRRFVIPTTYLSHSLFKVLLEKVEEEYGFDHSGGLTIPCETETFKYLLKCIEHHPNDHEEAGSSSTDCNTSGKE